MSMSDIPDDQVTATEVIEILRQENPMVLELAVRKAIINRQAETIQRLTAGQEEAP